MAQKQDDQQAVEWKPGSKCDVFDRDKMQWKDGEIIESFADEKGKWVKVKCGNTIRELLAIDPDLRAREMLSNEEVLKLERAAVQIPNIKSIVNRILPTNAAHGVYVYGDRKSLVSLSEYEPYPRNGSYLTVISLSKYSKNDVV